MMPEISRHTSWHTKGFSLIELIITLVVLAVMAVLAVPSITSLIRDSRLATQADLLVSSLNVARLEAVRQRKNHQVCSSTTPDSGSTCGANTDWGSGWIIKDSGTDVVQRIQAKTGITITTNSPTVEFNGTLGSATSVASFSLCATGSKQQQVDVSASGHVSKKINSGTTCP